MEPPLRPVSQEKQLSAMISASLNHDAPVMPTSHLLNSTLEPRAEDITAAAVTKAPNLFEHAGELHLPSPSIPSAITRRLYISHFLSTWNSRSFEFGAVLFLASIFPMTLLPLSIYAVVCSASAIVLAPLIGRTIDRRSRLPVARISIGE